MLKGKDSLSHSGGSVAEPKKRGRKQIVTADVVKRVGERVGLGVPLQYALILEKPPIAVKTFEMALSRNPEFVGAFKAEKAGFLERAYKRLSIEDDWRALVVLLERRHAVDFAKPIAEPVQPVINVTSVTNHFGKLTDEELEAIAAGRK